MDRDAEAEGEALGCSCPNSALSPPAQGGRGNPQGTVSVSIYYVLGDLAHGLCPVPSPLREEKALPCLPFPHEGNGPRARSQGQG